MHVGRYIYHTCHVCPLIFLIRCIKKVEKLTFENFDFLHLILFGPTSKKLTLKIAFICRRKWAGDLFWHWQAAIRCWLTARGKTFEKISQKVRKTMANLALQIFRPGSSILPSSSFRPEPGMQAAELQIDTQKRLPTLALFPNGSPSGYLGPTGDLFLYVGPLFCPKSPFSPID